MNDKTTPDLGSGATRRQLLAMAAVGGAGLAAVGAAAPGLRDGRDKDKDEHEQASTTTDDTFRLTVLGTTDLHGNVYNWDYFNNREYTDRSNNDVGLAKASTLIKAIRAEVGADTCITLDAGDTIQGTPLAYYYAKIDPITGGSTHPMAAAMNAVGYDAAALGNHEYNYGLDTLRAFEKQLDFPLLSANSVDWRTGAPVFKPWVIKTVKVRGQKPIKVGILGLVTPGVAIWDKANVEGKVRFPGIVEQAKVFVPRLKAAGADVVIVSCHSGSKTGSSYGDALPYPGERLLAPRRAGRGHRRDPRRARPRRDPAAARRQREDRQAGAALRALLLGHAGHADVARPEEGPREVAGRAGGFGAVQLQHRPGGPRGHRRRRGRAREDARLRQQRHRHEPHRHVGGDLALRGHRGDGLHQLRAGRRGQDGPRRHPRGEPARAVHRRAVQQARRHPGR